MKKIIVLALAMTLFVLPASTALAASNPELIVYIPGVVAYYDYRPDPYYLRSNTTTQLGNTVLDVNGDWVIPDFSNAWFHVELKNYSTYRLTVLKMNGSYFEVIHNDVHSGYGLGFGFPVTTEARYRILLTALTDTYIYGYCVYYQ